MLNFSASVLTRSLFVRALLPVVLAFSALAAQAQATFKVTAIPDESPTELARKAAPLVKYLEKALGRPRWSSPR
jgi:phosphonate transport system substrate-binding protein